MSLMPFDKSMFQRGAPFGGFAGPAPIQSSPLPNQNQVPLPSRPILGAGQNAPMAKVPQMGFFDKMKQRLSQPNFYQNLAQNLGQLKQQIAPEKAMPQMMPRPVPNPAEDMKMRRMQAMGQQRRASQFF